MSKSCLVCLDPVEGGESYHPKCLRELFATPRAPQIDVDLARLHTLALAMVGHSSIPGVQRKVSVSLEAGRGHLRVAAEGAQYLLKPQSQTFPALPENEHVTMRLALSLGIEIPRCGLVRLRDGSLAYLARRFDRPEAGGKLLQEDFCQLAGLSPKDKYRGSAELCARLLLKFASEPIIETLKLFRRMVFSWWTGNGDMHLKNFSLLRSPDGVFSLSPAYDLLCTRLVIPNDQLALSVAGNKKNVTRSQWLAFAEACAVPATAASRVLDEIAAAAADAQALVERSFLPADLKTGYQRLLRERSAHLADRRAHAKTRGKPIA